ncbi:MAG TPA: hypothetical protein VM240_02410 [Verrucomicrobiae bacterium]|nr:hypothetical protein [Verrucomicrobiae bacterium]
MTFPDNVGVMTCRCVMERGKPVLFVSHAGGDWQMYCHDQSHDFNDEAALKKEILLVHAAHLIARDQSLNAIADLPVDMGAERLAPGAEWSRFEDKDDD